MCAVSAGASRKFIGDETARSPWAATYRNANSGRFISW
jgi:hypothetical protein